jgi:hypothetical protein
MLCLLLLGGFASTHAQKPQLSVIAGAGTWRGWVKYDEDYHTSEFRKWYPAVNVGCGMGFAPRRAVAFALEAGLEYLPLTYTWSSLAGLRATSRLGMLSTRLSPGLRIAPVKGLQLRAALTILVASGTFGSYTAAWRNQGAWQETTYTHHFSRLRTLVNVGPELDLSWRKSLKNGGELGPRVSSYLSAYSVFSRDSDAPHRPHVFRLSLELVYAFPCHPKRYEAQ